MPLTLLLRRVNHLAALGGGGGGGGRSFRSDAALEALAKASEEKVPNVLLYNYPSFSGAFSALFAHLFHSRLNLPSLILPFSSVHPLRSNPSLYLSSILINIFFYLIIHLFLLQG